MCAQTGPDIYLVIKEEEEVVETFTNMHLLLYLSIVVTHA